MKRIIVAVGAALWLGGCGVGMVGDGLGNQSSAEQGGATGSGTEEHHDAGSVTSEHHCSDDTNENTCRADALGCRWLAPPEARCQSLNDAPPPPPEDAGTRR